MSPPPKAVSELGNVFAHHKGWRAVVGGKHCAYGPTHYGSDSRCQAEADLAQARRSSTCDEMRLWLLKLRIGSGPHTSVLSPQKKMIGCEGVRRERSSHASSSLLKPQELQGEKERRKRTINALKSENDELRREKWRSERKVGELEVINDEVIGDTERCKRKIDELRRKEENSERKMAELKAELQGLKEKCKREIDELIAEKNKLKNEKERSELAKGYADDEIDRLKDLNEGLLAQVRGLLDEKSGTVVRKRSRSAASGR